MRARRSRAGRSSWWSRPAIRRPTPTIPRSRRAARRGWPSMPRCSAPRDGPTRSRADVREITRAGRALRRLPGARAARHEPHGHGHVGHRLLARGGAQRQPAQAARRRARAAESPPRRAARLASDLPGPRSRRPAPVRPPRARRADARVAAPARRHLARRRAVVQRPRPAGRGATDDDRGRLRHHESGDGADVDLLGDLLLDRTLPGRHAAVRAGAAAHRAQRRAARASCSKERVWCRSCPSSRCSPRGAR